jgi:hypothetical protein
VPIESPSTGADAEDVSELLSLVPEAIRASCAPAEIEAEGAVAGAQCLHESGLIYYVRYVDLPTVEANYATIATMAGLTSDTGTDCAAAAFEGEYLAENGAVGGRLLCQVGQGASIIFAWTDVANLVIGVLEHPGADDWAGGHAAWELARLEPPSLDPAAPASLATDGPPSAPASPAADGTAGASVLPAAGEPLQQWAVGATASSEYGADAWSAMQATGEPDTTEYGDFATAWAPSVSDGGEEWLELTFERAVIPSEVVVYESSGNGFLTAIELWDPAAEAWVTAWQGEDGSPEFVVGFSPDLEPVGVATDRVRITIDTAVPGWNEVDAVALIGVPE